MPFPVSRIAGDVSFEALPVVKITNYPLEQRDYKPYAQCCLCLNDEGLHLRMWAFEVFSSAESELRGVFCLFADPALSLHVRALAAQPVRVDAWIEGGAAPVSIAVQGRPHNGEDLQGVYWGGELVISYRSLAVAAPLRDLSPGKSFSANFYKLRRDNPYVHMGSCYPAAFPENPFGADSMECFQIVRY